MQHYSWYRSPQGSEVRKFTVDASQSWLEVSSDAPQYTRTEESAQERLHRVADKRYSFRGRSPRSFHKASRS